MHYTCFFLCFLTSNLGKNRIFFYRDEKKILILYFCIIACIYYITFCLQFVFFVILYCNNNYVVITVTNYSIF